MIQILIPGLILCYLLVGTYRVTVHPLAKVPGPFWAAVSGWSTWLQIIKGDQHLHLQRLHEKYGMFATSVYDDNV